MMRVARLVVAIGTLLLLGIFSCCSAITMENEHTMIHRMDHSSHPYGFEHEMNSSFRLKQGSSIWSQTNDGVDSNYLLVSSVYSQQNTPLSYSHYELKNETFPFIKNRKVSGNLLRVKVVNDGHFQIIAPYGRCCQPSKLTNIFQSSLHEDSTEDPCKERTSTTAKQNDCLVATNAGFFDVPHGYCIGRVISNGKVLNTASGHNAVFGFIDHADHPQYLYGYVNDTELTKLKPTQLVQGALWLVREGKSFVNESIKIEKTSQAFCDLAAPRVAIGNDINGNLMILQVNGYEPQKLGLNVYEMTDLLLFLGFQNAVNLDGGGSATTFIKGYPTLFNTCSDSCSEIEGNMCPNAKIGRCERHVTTIVCLK